MNKLISACIKDFQSSDEEGLIILVYPKAYGNTSGPFGGIGGNTITWHPVVVVADRTEQRAIVYFAGPMKKRPYDLKETKISDMFWSKFQRQDF